MKNVLNKIELKPKALVGLFLAIILIVVGCSLPSLNFTHLSFNSDQVKTLAVLLAFLCILISEALPVVITSFLFIGLLFFTGIAKDSNGAASLKVALDGFSDPVVYFTLASFGLAAAFTTTPIAKRILKKLLKVFGKSINTAILALMVCTALISSIISNVPTCAVFMSIALSFLNVYTKEEDKKRTGKVLMIGIPMASMIGGMMTPAGSSINLIAIGLLEKNYDVTISFVKWMAVGIPLAVVLLPIAWFLLIKVFKPAPLSKEKIQEFVSNIDVPEKITPIEIKAWIIALSMLILWILSSWFSFFNVMAISLIGCALLMFPGIKVITVETFIKENSWDAFFLVGTVLSLGTVMKNNEVITAITSSLPNFNMQLFFFLLLVCLIVFLFLIILPVATSLITLIGAALMAIGVLSGIDPALVILCAALCASNCYLLPLDTVMLITYGEGYYSMTDCLKVSVILQLLMALLCSSWVALIGPLLF